MAAVTSAVIGGIGLAANGIQAISSAKQKKKAQRELNNYERQDLENAYKNAQISTVGSDLMREESSRTTASLVDMARGGGIRGIMGALPKIQGYSNQANAEARKYLDDQFLNREQNRATDEMRLRAMREDRDNQNISALSSQIDASNQDMWSGITGAANSLAYMGSGLEAREYSNDQVSGVNELKSNGLAPMSGGQISTSMPNSLIKSPFKTNSRITATMPNKLF